MPAKQDPEKGQNVANPSGKKASDELQDTGIEKGRTSSPSNPSGLENPRSSESERAKEVDKATTGPQPEKAPDGSPKGKDASKEEPPAGGPIEDEGIKSAIAQTEDEGSDKPAKPAATKTITIDGEGPITFHTEGAVRNLERGKPVEVTEADIASLKAAEITFSEGKKAAKSTKNEDKAKEAMGHGKK